MPQFVHHGASVQVKQPVMPTALPWHKSHLLTPVGTAPVGTAPVGLALELMRAGAGAGEVLDTLPSTALSPHP